MNFCIFETKRAVRIIEMSARRGSTELTTRKNVIDRRLKAFEH